MQYITIVRGRLKGTDVDAARDLHNAIVDELRRRAERLLDVTYEAMMRGIAAVRPGATTGDIGAAIQAYVEPQDPGSFVAVDRWSNIEGLQQFLGDPNTQASLGSMFDGQPKVTVLAEREGWRAF